MEFGRLCGMPGAAKAITGEKLLQMVSDGSFFGLVEVQFYSKRRCIAASSLSGFQVDICVPEFDEGLRKQTAAFPQIFKNVDLTREDLSPRMREYAETNDIMSTPRRSLVSSHYGKKILLTSPLLK